MRCEVRRLRDFADKGDLRLDYARRASSMRDIFCGSATVRKMRHQLPHRFRCLSKARPNGPHSHSGPAGGALGYTGTSSAPIKRPRRFASASRAPKPASTPLSALATAPFDDPRPAHQSRRSPAAFQSIGISGGFSAFGRQTTNPQFQNPALLDPKVNYTWVKGATLDQAGL